VSDRATLRTMMSDQFRLSTPPPPNTHAHTQKELAWSQAIK
jgi:hypothetical protein